MVIAASAYSKQSKKKDRWVKNFALNFLFFYATKLISVLADSCILEAKYITNKIVNLVTADRSEVID